MMRSRVSCNNWDIRKLHAKYYFTTSLFNRINDSKNQIVFIITESTILRIESLGWNFRKKKNILCEQRKWAVEEQEID